MQKMKSSLSAGRCSLVACMFGALFIGAMKVTAVEPAKPPTYVQATAYHVLPGTHNNESGYFSLCEGLDGTIYIGTAKYGENSYLVEFDPRTLKQRIVMGPTPSRR